MSRVTGAGGGDGAEGAAGAAGAADGWLSRAERRGTGGARPDPGRDHLARASGRVRASRGRRRRRADLAVAVIAALALLLVHATAPDDGWAHAQPRTMAYAVDIATGGSWVLPRDEQGLPSTKPPLHPWLAAPAVAAAGPQWWATHRWPDLAAAFGVAVMLVVVGRRWWPRANGDVGALAATMWLSSLTGAKVAVLARPDMLLTAGVTVAWLAFAGMIVAGAQPAGVAGRRRRMVAPFLAPFLAPRIAPWIVAGGAAVGGLAKGPAVLPLAVALWLAARWTGPAGRAAWRRVRTPGVLAAALLPPAAWLAAATMVDPAWVVDGLVRGEVLDRVSGSMEDAGGRGPVRMLETLGYMPTYLGIRFLPWTVPLVLAAVLVMRPRMAVRARGRRTSDILVPRIALAVVVATVVIFTFSSGKRADYLAPCLPAGSLAAAWWMVRGDRGMHARRPWLVPLAAGALLLAQVVHQRQPANGLPAAAGEAIAEVGRMARRVAATESLPLMSLGSGGTSLPLRLGLVPADPPSRFGDLVAEGRPFLMAHATFGPAPIDGVRWATAHPRVGEAVLLIDRRGRRTARLDGADGLGPGSWGAWLVRVEPLPSVASGDPPDGAVKGIAGAKTGAAGDPGETAPSTPPRGERRDRVAHRR